MNFWDTLAGLLNNYPQLTRSAIAMVVAILAILSAKFFANTSGTRRWTAAASAIFGGVYGLITSLALLSIFRVELSSRPGLLDTIFTIVTAAVLAPAIYLLLPRR
jgi:succinate dehydrogenase hydrophobic anchor subunit